jgi:hypothetical protein
MQRGKVNEYRGCRYMNAYDHPKISYWSRGLSKRGLHHNGGEWLKLLGAAELASAKSS